MPTGILKWNTENGKTKGTIVHDGREWPVKYMTLQGLGVTTPQGEMEVTYNQTQNGPREIRMPQFNNPYNFIPALANIAREGDLMQRAPVGHAAYFDGHYTGSITIQITAKSPLLLPDTSKTTTTDGHATVETLRDAAGNPKLMPSALKGPLRAAYEAITNSRLGVFNGKAAHERVLGQRMNALLGLQMVPARVADNGNDLELYLGNSSSAKKGEPPAHLLPKRSDGHIAVPNNEMYAAWLPRYGRRNIDAATETRIADAVTYGNGQVPQHLDHVVCWLQKIDYRRQDTHFKYYRVVKIAKYSKDEDALGVRPDMAAQIKPERAGVHTPTQTFIKAEGYVCISNRNMGRKHDERVFFVKAGDKPFTVPIKPDWRERWSSLIADYALTNERERKRRGDGIKQYSIDGKKIVPAFSRHTINAEGEKDLTPGTLCYARVESGEITGLYPVMISRELMPSAPCGLLPDQLKPAEDYQKLSPADRVFGWVHPKGKDAPGNRPAHRGQLRVDHVKYVDQTGGIEPPQSNIAIPLAILSSPKPQQTRFYGAKDQSGTPVDSGVAKDKLGYGSDKVKGLRGRKVYPYQPLSEDYWNFSIEQAKPWQSKGGSISDQNRSIKDWIKPGTQFEARIDVVNLNNAELGALLWLLNLGDNHFLRLGGGKPLGFGSVAVKITSVDLRDGVAMREDFASFDRNTESGNRIALVDAIATPIDAYKKAIQTAYGKPFEQVPFIAAFINACKGSAVATHYPRLQDPAPPEIYKWFMENDKGKKVSLPSLAAADWSLPFMLKSETDGAGLSKAKPARY